MDIFLPLAKVDLDQRLVIGVVAAESPDRSGEIMDYATSRPYFAKWSEEARTATGGRSLGAIRSMHNKIAAGKVTSLVFNDEAKQIEIVAKIVDDTEWTKCIEGVYSGFSQGGRYVRRWKDEGSELTRYTAEPSEISLVDLPCLSSATFEIVKADGAVEIRKFASTVADDAEIRRRAESMALAKAAVDERTANVDHLLRTLQADVDAVLKSSPGYAARVQRCGTLDRDSPAPARAAIRGVPIAGTPAGANAELEAFQKRLDAMSPEERALELTKLSLANPIKIAKE